jgi:cytochrome c-type biogenesis protein CcmH
VRRALALFAALMALGPATVLAAEPKTTLGDVEDEVMCPVCGTPLSLSTEAPQAERERALIVRLIEQGKSKEEIKDELARQFGPEVLATPEGEGFDLAAWLIPGLAIVAALAALGLAWRRWRRRGAPAAGVPAAAAPSPEDAARLEADLRRYDA